MKRLVTFLLLAALLAVSAFDASAQRYIADQFGGNASGYVQPASTATNRNLVIDCRFQPSFTLQMNTTTATAGASTLGFGLTRSVDGVTYPPDAMYTFSATGTNVFLTNMPTLGAGWAKITYTTNATGATNITAWAIKVPINSASPNP